MECPPREGLPIVPSERFLPARRRGRRSPGKGLAGSFRGATSGTSPWTPFQVQGRPIVDEPADDITFLLRGARRGDREAGARLLPVIYEELHRLARRSMNGQSKSHLLQATALVNEAFLRLIDGKSAEIADRTHFFNLAALAMRQILIDHARAARAGREVGRAIDVEFDALVDRFHERGGDMLELEDALKKLAALDPDLERIVNLKFFGGLSIEEIALALGRSPRSIERDWAFARRWLRRELGG